MSLTATISTSASDSWAARNTLRPMRPKPLMPTRTAMRRPFRGRGAAAVRLPKTPRRSRRVHACGPRTRGSGPARDPVDVAVRDLDEVLVAIAEHGGEVLGDGDRAVAPAG